MRLTSANVTALKSSIENVRQDLLEAIKFSEDKNFNSSLCKVKSAVFNNTKTLNIINKLEKKGE